MIFLLTRPFVWLIKLVKAIVTAPMKMVRSSQNRRARKNAKFAANAVREQAKAAK